jgi:23S rRNA (uridine2552-2'-O)-methyltransferase
LLDVEPLAGATFIQGDIQSSHVMKLLQEYQLFDIVLSDMAHSFTGNPALDRDRVFHLCEFALYIASQHLSPNGNFVCKYMKGSDLPSLARYFKSFKSVKPKSSRKESREDYFVGIGFQHALYRKEHPDDATPY